jgi:hypothetical protein
MDGQGRTDNPGYVGVHSTDWMEDDFEPGHDSPRVLFYPWQYLSESYGGKFYMTYEHGAPEGSTSFDTVGAWLRGVEPRHADISSV